MDVISGVAGRFMDLPLTAFIVGYISSASLFFFFFPFLFRRLEEPSVSLYDESVVMNVGIIRKVRMWRCVGGLLSLLPFHICAYYRYPDFLLFPPLFLL